MSKKIYLVYMSQCFQCNTPNPTGNAFCGACGSPLVLGDFIQSKVEKGIADSLKDREVLERESSIRVFEKVFGWTKLFWGAAATLAAIATGLGIWKATDLWSAVNQAKAVVSDTSDRTQKDITQKSSKAVADIQDASGKAITANQQSVIKAGELSQELDQTAGRTKKEIAGEAASVKADVGTSKTELQAVHQLKPEFDDMRAQLGKATTDLAAQQKVISSSEEFLKKVFSTHAVALFTFDRFVKPNSIVLPAPAPGVNTTVLMLLPATPIPGTLQLQYYISVEPPGSFINVHNLVVFSWGDPADNLRQRQMSASYFPDASDKDLIHTLTVKEGRVFADDQPLPKFGQPDPDFKGNKWMTIAPPRPNPPRKLLDNGSVTVPVDPWLYSAA